LKASQSLSEWDPWVIDMHTLKPIDHALIRDLSGKCKLIVTVEDHNVIGGLGSAVAEVLAEGGFSGKLLRLGVNDTYGESGEATSLYEKYGISSNQIVERTRLLLSL
jgi:transketolase